MITGNEEMSRVSKEKLLQEGFLFKYITHIYRNKKGTIYFFCYDHGYLVLENDWYLIVRHKSG
nr:hypothetical protein [uncultured bacterium]